MLMVIRKVIKVFKYNDLRQDYIEFGAKLPFDQILNSDSLYLFIDPHRKRVWVWQGNNTTIRMRFLSARIASHIRDRYGTDFKITTVDEGNEPLGFKVMTGVEKEPNDIEIRNSPNYLGTEEDLELLESLRREKMRLIRGRINNGDN
jgi:hypothetical protein